VPIGKGIPTSTGVRNKKMAVLVEIKLFTSDYDYTKLSLTPSISLFTNIPENPIQSFYSEQVYIVLKDTTFKASSALRHATEFYNSIEQHYSNTSSLPEIIIIYTDRGSNHHCNFGSVQISLISLFLNDNFDLVIATHIAPYHIRMPHDDFQSLSFIPDPELLENEFYNVYGQPTSEKFHPSAMNNSVSKDPNEKNWINLITQKLDNEEIQLQATLDGLCYTCGSQLLPEDHELLKHLSVKLNITCNSPIEATYFSWRLKKLDICYWCRESEDLIEPSDKLKAEWKTIYPLCAFCKENGKTWYKRAQKKFIQ
ncbi:14781_t:CDS:2, partial [Racocetra fulgida]